MRSMSPELARSALDAAPDAMVIVDSAGLVLYANQQTTSLFGYSHEELIGRGVDMLLPERLRLHHPAHREAYWRTPRLRPMGAGLQLFACRRDGSEFPVEISLSPVSENGGILVAAAIRDISERRRIEAELAAQLEEMRRLHAVSTRLLAASDPVELLGDLLGTVIELQGADFGHIQLRDDLSSGALRIVAQRGFSEGFLTRFSLVDVQDPACSARTLRSGERVVIEDVEEDPAYLPLRDIAAMEGYRAVQSTPIRGRDGTTIGALSTYFRARHRPPDSVLQLTDIYLRLLSQLLTRVQDESLVRAARDRADRANQAKSRFLATASHDLRQPVQTLALLNGTLRRISSSDDALEIIGQQERAIGAMSRLLNALLDISKLESGAIRPDPSDFEVAALFNELRQEFAEVASGKGLKLQVQVDGDGAVRSDRSLVEQILRNLLSNAIKYTRHGGVQLRSELQGKVVRVEVLDTGIGIPADQLPYIYDEFYQVPGRPKDGYGLGLSIVQRLVALLGVRFDVHSEPGKGSSFVLHLPSGVAGLRGPDARPAPRAVAETIGPSRPQVLLVEDEEAVRRATRMLLRVEGYRVREAASLEEALRAIEEGGPVDVVISDYHLGPGQTGSQVIQRLRDRLGEQLPAVLISGDTSSAMRELPHDGRVRVASKPVRADELLALLRELLAAELTG